MSPSSVSVPTAHPHSLRVFVPVKSWARAKTRLALPEAARARLARAFATDTLRALTAADPEVDVVVVTDDPRVRSDLASGPWRFLVDQEASGLNDALSRAVQHPRYADDRGVVAMCADLPALRPQEAAAVFATLVREPRADGAFVGDTAGHGTTLLATHDRTAFRPAFGVASRAAHAALGWQDLSAVVGPGVRHDVDTVADLQRVLALGVGEETARAAAELEDDLGLTADACR